MFNPRKKLFSFRCLLLMACSFWLLSSCDTINLYEKVVPVPKHQWQSRFRPKFTFNIQDTTVPYQAFVILRHNNQYRYNNIWVNLWGKSPSGTVQKLSLELPLANKEGWLGSGMDDVYEHRVRLGTEMTKLGFITAAPEGFYFRRSGEYTFSLEQIMRDNPLLHVMNIGLRLEKKTP